MVTALEEELRNDVDQASEPTSIPLRGILSNNKTSSFRQLGGADTHKEVTLGPTQSQARLSSLYGNVNVVLGHTAFD